MSNQNLPKPKGSAKRDPQVIRKVSFALRDALLAKSKLGYSNILYIISALRIHAENA